MSLPRVPSCNDLTHSRNSSRLRRKLALLVQDKLYSMQPPDMQMRMLRWLMMLLMLELQALLVRVVDSRQSIDPSGQYLGPVMVWDWRI